MSTFVWCGIICTQCNVPIYGVQTLKPNIPRRAIYTEAQKLGAVKLGDQWFCGKGCRHKYKMSRNLRSLPDGQKT